MKFFKPFFASVAISTASASGNGLRGDTTNTTNIFDVYNGTTTALNQDPTTYIGCYNTYPTIENDVFRLSVKNFDTFAKAEIECATTCSDKSSFVGVAKSKNSAGTKQFVCRCYSTLPDPTDNRLAFGSCNLNALSTIPDKDKMQLYFVNRVDPGCADPGGDQLVRKINSHYGFDLLTSEFKRFSLFDIKQKGCHTNMYQVEVLNEGLATSVSSSARQLTSFRDEMKRSVDFSFDFRGEAGATFDKIIGIGGSVAASFSSETSKMFKSSGAQESSSKFFSSYKEDRKARVFIDGFRGKKHFVELHRSFSNLLKDYKKNGYPRSDAESIFADYGHLVMIEGIYGGYISQHTTAGKSVLTSSLESDSAASSCYAQSSEAQFSILGFGGGSTSTETNGCTKAVQKSLTESTKQYLVSSEGVEYYGMDLASKTVTAQSAQLFESLDLYQGRNKIKFRFLFEFLHPDKIHPLTIDDSGLGEADFQDIYDHLWNHTEQVLSDANSNLGDCLKLCEGGLPYMEYNTNERRHECQCYNPDVPATLEPTPSPVDNYCDDFGTFPASISNQCGSINQGGSECEPECCSSQKDYCLGACNLDLEPDSCLAKCMHDRGCDFGYTGLTCSDLDFSARKSYQCGTASQGGSQCEAQCCPTQKDYCRGACKANTDPNRCLMNCLGDRGCGFDSAGLRCSDFGTFSAGPSNKCGSRNQGGSHCKSKCCEYQRSYCDRVCRFGGCKTRCKKDRGC